MKKSKEKLIYSKKGITLISLVVTIVVLLILTGVTINLVLAEGGLFERAEEAKSAQKLAEYKDIIEVTKAGVVASSENKGKVLISDLVTELGKEDIVAEDEDGDGIYEITVEGLEGKITLVQEGNSVKVTYPDNTVSKGEEQEPPKDETTPTIGETTTEIHTATKLSYEWEEMNIIAKAISDNYGEGTNQVNNQTEEVTIIVDNKSYTVGVGDEIELTDKDNVSYTVRIMGFNHDQLVDPTDYDAEETAETVYAGISFEFVDFLTGTDYRQMNTSDTNENDWVATKMRKELNGYTSNDAIQSGEIAGLGATLTNREYIKQVKKDYLPDYDSADLSSTPSEDYLWLLSCAEIWSVGTKTTGKGGAIGTEGSQYKWYANNEIGGTRSYNTENSKFVKKTTEGSSISWWLRSPGYNDGTNFNSIGPRGCVEHNYAHVRLGIAPGFCI